MNVLYRAEISIGILKYKTDETKRATFFVYSTQLNIAGNYVKNNRNKCSRIDVKALRFL